MNKIENFYDDLNMKGVTYDSRFFDSPSHKLQIQNHIKTLLLSRNKDKASESIVSEMKKRFRFYAIRSDEKRELWIYEDGIYINNGGSYVEEYCRQILDELFTSNFSNLAIDKIAADVKVTSDWFFNQNIKNEIAVKNGILNIDTRELKEFDPTKVFFNKLPVTYDKLKKINKLLHFFKDVTKEEKDVPILQELFGSILLKEYKHERCFMIVGDGRNGKGKFGVIIKHFIGSDNIANLQPSVIENVDSFSTHKLHGKLVNLSLDIAKTSLKNTSMLKSLSGRDIVTCPRKFKEPITFVNYAKMIFGCNELPDTYDNKDAFWERWVLLEFPYTFVPEERYDELQDKTLFKIRDPDIINKIISEDELSGLLNWALDGYKRLEQQKDFSYYLDPSEVMAKWVRRSDSFAAFYMDRLEYNYGSKILKDSLRKNYVSYCKRHNSKVKSDKAIARYMEEEGITSERNRQSTSEYFNEYYWDNVKIKNKYGYENEDFFNYFGKRNIEEFK